MSFTNDRSYAVRVGDVVVEPGESLGSDIDADANSATLLARKKSTNKSTTDTNKSEEDAS